MPSQNTSVDGTLHRDIEDTNTTIHRDSDLDMDISHSHGNKTEKVNVNGSDHISYEEREGGGSLESEYKLDWNFVNAVTIKPVKVVTCDDRCAKFCEVMKGKEQECKDKCHKNFCSGDDQDVDVDVEVSESRIGSSFVMLASVVVLGAGATVIYRKINATRRKGKRVTTFEEDLVGYKKL